jgi:hypothetical protein
VAVAVALAFFGIGLLGMALAAFLAQTLGTARGYALAGTILLVPPLLWAAILQLSRPRKPVAPPNSGTSQVVRALFAAIVKETPWIAIVGAGLAGATEMFLNRNKTKK